MPSTLSPNMSLILPTVGQEPGPNWALDLNSSLSTVDQHDHSAGSGVQITPAGMNINTDLSFGSNNALSLRSVRMNSQVAPLALGADINCIYVSNGNLFYNDNLGNQVQITTGGAVAGTPGSIGNLIAPAAVTYVPANQTFVFQSNQGNNTPGAIDCGPLYLRNISPASNYVQIQPNAVLPASYSLTLPSSLPASQQFLSVNNLGNIISVDPDNSTVEISANVLRVKDLGITTAKINNLAVTTAKIADSNVTTVKIADQNVTPVKRSPGGFTRNYLNFNTTVVSANKQLFSTLTLTTSAPNKVVCVSLSMVDDGAYWGGGGNAKFYLMASGPGLGNQNVASAWGDGYGPGGIGPNHPIIGFIQLPQAGTYTFTLNISTNPGGYNVYIYGGYFTVAELG